MKYLSVCSGIEAASVAWHPLGWHPLAFSEIEPFPRAVLAHHYPDVACHGDFTKLRDEPWIVDADVLVGGTPCQAFSVAGLRKSLDDDRGNLSLEFVRLADAIDAVRLEAGRSAAVIVWENVPGVLSVKDNAFGCFLAGLAGDVTPYDPPRGKWTNAGVVDGPQRSVAWRILDAQYFGLAQRRRRVFVVASARDGLDPAAVLLEFEGVRRDTPPRREKGQIAPTIPSRSTAGGGLGTDFDCDGGVITLAHGQGGAEVARERSPTLTCVHEAPIAAIPVAHTLKAEGFDASEDGTGRGTPLVPVAIREDATPKWQDDLAFTLTQPSPSGGGHPQSVMVPVAFDTTQITSPSNYSNPQPGDPCHPLAAGAHPPAIAFHPTQDPISSTDGSTHALGCGSKGGQASVAVTYPINTQIALRHEALCERTGLGIGSPDDPIFTLQAGHSHAVAVQASQSGVRVNDTVGTLDANYGSRRHNGVMQHMAVRRLTPTECERLQGFPDGYTMIPWKKKPAEDCPDGPRYKAIGNSMAVPVMRWIGKRIVEVLA